jgi:hypothetical protein
MSVRSRRSPAALGVTVKSGWACAVLLGGPPASPRVLDSRRIELSDPADPEARQPYHAGFGTARTSGAALSRLVASVEQFGRGSVTALIGQHRAAGHGLRGVGIVVGSLIDPARIGNEHIRIHALEGQLFRRVVEEAARQCRLPCAIWRERDVYKFAADALAQPEPEVRATLTALGRPLNAQWRAEQKAAALAAWIVCENPTRAR